MKQLFLIFLISIATGWINFVQAQTKVKLSICGNKFCINGQAKFLVLASYFDALDAAYLQTDLDYLQVHKINGIRIFPNWWGPQGYSGHTLFDSLGNVRPGQLKRLKTVLNAAKRHGMVVDITFAHETVKGLNINNYKKGIIHTVRALKNYTNIFYDLQNERNGSPTYLSVKNIIALRDTLKFIQPDIILSASEAYGATPAEDINFVARTGMDIINYHEPRIGSWWKLTYKRTTELCTSDKPVYLGEPGRWRPGSSLTAANLITAVIAAKKAGAAAWTFHNEASFNLDHSSLVSHLNPDVEQAFLESFHVLLHQTKWGDN